MVQLQFDNIDGQSVSLNRRRHLFVGPVTRQLLAEVKRLGWIVIDVRNKRLLDPDGNVLPFHHQTGVKALNLGLLKRPMFGSWRGRYEITHLGEALL